MWEYKHSDELYHWKYIKKEKDKNGKWRYYYDKNAIKNQALDQINKTSDAIASISPESGREFDDFVYDVNDEKLKLEKQAKLAKIEREHPEDDFMKSMKVSSIVVSNKVKSSANDFLKRLNNVGDGLLDNRIRRIAKEGYDFFKSIFDK